MANANPSGLGYTVPAGAPRPEPNIPVNQTPVVRSDGITVLRTVMTNGNVVDTQVFPGDHPKAISEKEYYDGLNAKSEGKGKGKDAE